MIKSTIEKMANPIGFEIGTSDDIIQSELLNGFCKGLSNSILDKNSLEMQLCYVSEKLNKTSEDLILHLAEFIKEKRKND